MKKKKESQGGKKSLLWPVFLKQFHAKAHKEGGSISQHLGETGTAARSRGGHPRGFGRPRRWLPPPGAEEAGIAGAVCLHTWDPSAWHSSEEALPCWKGQDSKPSAAAA